VKVRVSRLHAPVTALGPGRRLGIWLQGCAIACPGCVSRDTWAADDRLLVETADVLDWCASWPAGEFAGVTITGGEPSEQPAALADLTAALRARPEWSEWDVLCYTGVEEGEFAARCPGAYERVDALITGPYRAEQPSDLVWRGSANQRLVPLTARGHARYDPYVNARADRPAIQLHVDNSGVWMIGVPRRGDLPRLERALRASGVRLDGVSWRP
jgi:anaerobic ribonucleoside-triphosphate reductase activating protein